MTVYQCDYCKKYVNDNRLVSYIGERRNGKSTGRIFTLCQACEIDYYKREIASLTDKLGYLPSFKQTGMSVRDAQEYLTEWNKNKKHD